MINMFEVNETNKMITQENLDVRTITLGISLLDCIDADLEVLNENIYRQDHNRCEGSGSNRSSRLKENMGFPIVNKRISVTPIAFVGGKACKMSGRLCEHCKNTGSCRKRGWRQLYRRLLRTGIKGHDKER